MNKSTAYLNIVRTQFDSICNDPKLVLGSNSKGLNNKFVERGYQRIRLTLKEKRLNLLFVDGLT